MHNDLHMTDTLKEIESVLRERHDYTTIDCTIFVYSQWEWDQIINVLENRASEVKFSASPVDNKPVAKAYRKGKLSPEFTVFRMNDHEPTLAERFSQEYDAQGEPLP